jgi:hypothetical protein
MKQHLQDISDIRSMMERSSRFISLSGLSGIFAGTFALIGAFVAHQFLLKNAVEGKLQSLGVDSPIVQFLLLDAFLVLVLSLGFSIYFTAKQTQKKGLKLWDNTSKRLLSSMLVPLATGGLFCIILLFNASQLISSATLVFYGLALVSASKHTFDNVKYLGFVQIALGLACGWVHYWPYSLLFWAMGFGVCHIVYGIVMYRQQKG